MRSGEVNRSHHEQLFADYAQRVFEAPLFAPEGAEAPIDFMWLSLASFRDHLMMSSGTQRNDGTPFKAFAAYADRSLPNAFAWAEEDIHFCGVMSGLPVAIYEFSNFCFSQKTLFTDIGDTQREIAPKPDTDYPPGFWMREAGVLLDRHQFQRGGCTFLPRDPTRVSGALFLSLLTLRFIWLHELYHCLNGHVGLLRAQSDSRGLDEHATYQATKVTNRQYQCLELDADRSAIFAATMVTLKGMENIEGLLGLSEETALRLTIFGAYCLTWYFEEHARRQALKTDPKHPPPYLRLLDLMQTIASNVMPQTDKLPAIHTQTLVELDRLADILPTFRRPGVIIDDARNPALHDLLQGLQAELETLRLDLSPYRFS